MRVSGNEGRGPLAQALQRTLAERGWWGVGWPKEFGGLGKTAVEQYIFIEEMDLAGAPGMQLSVTSVAPTIMRIGTKAQQDHWLPRGSCAARSTSPSATPRRRRAPIWRASRPARCSTAMRG